ncbi:MAG: glucose-1-phosphate adenylyltransferase [Clostridia bacterium]|nr:glucose-1-phosphate adenylyltransferase [Clostridia bacterium]
MIKKNRCIAMLLAGGQGSRLHVLTKNIAKPAVPFGAKYRIIDFTLSNCINSGIDVVGVLTQYQPLVLNRYIRNGLPWDLDRLYGGVYILPPYQQNSGTAWYKGTANAIFQNIRFIEQYSPDYVLILSGDHIYSMDYSKMIEYHEEKGADATIAVIKVPIAEASRFGIMNTASDGKIVSFEEKPKVPKNNEASMGIYVFSWNKLKKYLIEDDANSESSNDFGKNIIPQMLNSGEKMYAYPFNGYWKDVGTIDSLWEANMDLLNDETSDIINNPDWRIYARNPVCPPQYIGDGATLKDTIVSEGSEIYGTIDHSVIFYKVFVDRDVYIKDSIIMQDAVINKGARIVNAIIGDHTVIGENAVIGGEEDADGRKIAVIGSGAVIEDNEIIAPGEMIDRSDEPII